MRMLRGASRGRFGRRIGPTTTLLLSVHDLRVDFFKTIERLVLELVFDSSRASSVCDAARVWCDCGLLWWRFVFACFESATRRVVILRGSMFVDFRLAAARSKRTAWCDVWCCCAVCPEGSAVRRYDARRCARGRSARRRLRGVVVALDTITFGRCVELVFEFLRSHVTHVTSVRRDINIVE